MNKSKIENNISIKDIINNKEYLYIIMELCEYNLEEVLKKNKPISINEIKLILTQLNNIFKVMLNEKIIYGDLKLNNILISIDRLDKCLIKLSYSNQFITQSNSITNENSLTTPPKFIKDKKTNIKSDIWSL